MWIFILGDMTIFGAIMIALMALRYREPELVVESAARLLVDIGFANTLVLLISSYLVICAIQAHRVGRGRAASYFIVGALCCGATFIGLKAVEYSCEIFSGATPTTNVFFTYYFALTGLHVVHVMIGAALLRWWWASARSGRSWTRSQVAVEAIAVYWHMVDLLWIAIFTLAYLVCAQ